MNHLSATHGVLEVITGCMFAEKSTALISQLRRAQFGKKRVVGVKPHIDNRYSETSIASHNQESFPAVLVANAQEILTSPEVQNAEVVGIDEAQFFDDTILDVCRTLVGQGKRVIVAGLDMDYRGVPFGVMPTLMAIAFSVEKLHAVCTVCGADASQSQRVVNSSAIVVTGGAESYEARCTSHWSPEPIFAREGGGSDD